MCHLNGSILILCETLRVGFKDLSEFDDAFVYDWTRSGPKLADDRKKQFATHTFPVLLIGTEDPFVLSNWMQDYRGYWEHEVTKCGVGTIEHSEASRALEYAHDFVSRVQAITTKYQVTYVELDRELTLVKVCEIFTQINSRGVRLDVFDLINAMLTPRGLELRYMWEDAAPRLEFVESNRMNVYVLQVMSLILQSYCSPNYLYYLIPGQERKIRAADGTLRKEILVPSAVEFRERWNKAIKSLETRDCVAASSARVWGDLVPLPSLCFDHPCVLSAPVRGA